jgi:hypothetical protein
VAGEGVDEVLQLEGVMGEVRRGPKGADEGGTGELTKRERNGDAVTRRRHGGGGPIDRRGHEAEERGRGGEVLGRAHEGGREGNENGGTVVMGCPL